VRIATAFLSASDTNPLVLPLRELVARGGDVEILTSVMGFFNSPETLRAFRDWGDGLELRLYHEAPEEPFELLSGAGRAFHAKTLLIEKHEPPHVLAVGSANATAAGMERNVEWTYLSDFEVNVALGELPSPYARAVDLFDTIWKNLSFVPSDDFLERYEGLHRRSESLRRELRKIRSEPEENKESGVSAIAPRPAQQAALKAMAEMRRDGIYRYAVIAATGIGKTMLSAFDVRNTGVRNVLFLAHRETILDQAMSDYDKVLPGRKAVKIQGGDSLRAVRVNQESLLVFAMVATLGRYENFRKLPKDYFDYVIVDEFHHASASQYGNVLGHFTPRYLLGMTATPERMDGQDVLSVCDRQVAYEVRLLDAIDRRWLAPFQYYALHDSTDYSRVTWTGKGYDDHELEVALSQDTRADLIVRNLRRFQPASGSRKCLAFCSNVGHAQWMARAFSARGITAAALVGTTSQRDRVQLIERLQADDDPLEILCSVDVLNEGIDVPSATHILLLRPTNSFTVFLQQLGRGLRLHRGKEFVVVLDFVGNYRKSSVAPLALQGRNTLSAEALGVGNVETFLPPHGCYVDADTEVRRIWEKDLRALRPRKSPVEVIRDALEEITRDEGDVSLVRLPELFTFMVGSRGIESDVRRAGGWLRARVELNIAGDYEESLLETAGEEFLRHVEEELNPNKSYKMAILHAILDIAAEDVAAGNPVSSSWLTDELAQRFLAYYLTNARRIADWTELAKQQNPVDFPLQKAATHIKKMPLHRLSDTDSKPFSLDSHIFSVKDRYVPYWQADRFRDLLRERVEYAEARYWYTHSNLASAPLTPRDVRLG
jgi:superfamily II DNA or RNA helicase